MRNVCKYMAFVVAVVMALMMVSCGADKGTDVSQDAKSTATNSKSTSSVVSSEVVSSVAVSNEAVSSVAASSEASSVAVSSEAPVVSKAPVSSKTPTVSKAPVASKEPVASTAPAVSSSAPVATGNANGWVCPDPEAHGQDNLYLCVSASEHDRLVKKRQDQIAYSQWLKENPPALDPAEYCSRCGRPWGDGYNGTCKGFLCHGTRHCHHYDTGETCQLPFPY